MVSENEKLLQEVYGFFSRCEFNSDERNGYVRCSLKELDRLRELGKRLAIKLGRNPLWDELLKEGGAE